MSRRGSYISEPPLVQHTRLRDAPDGGLSKDERDDVDVFLQDNARVFCNKENLLNSVGYINQEFQLLSLDLVKFSGPVESLDAIVLINRIYDLLRLYRKAVSGKEELENRIHRLTCEIEHHHSKNLRLKSLQEQTDRELDKEQEKHRQVNVKYKQVCSKLKAEKEEIKRMTAVLQSRDLQHKHEHKKKEREVHKLKERLHQLLADKAPDRKVGMDLMNVVSRGEGRRGTWKTGPGKQEEEMYQLLIGNYEERCSELVQENEELRDCLLSLQRELSALLKRTGDMSIAPILELSSSQDDLSSSSEDGFEDQSAPPSRLSIADLNEGYFQMPYDMVRNEIEKTFKDTCNQISESMKKSLRRNLSKRPSSFARSSKSEDSSSGKKESQERRMHSASLDAEVDKLKKQVAKYKEIIHQQEELIQQSLSSQSQSVESTFLHESQLLKEKEDLSEQRKLFFEEKANFEKERRSFTEAAIRLNKEKKLLQEDKAQLLKQYFLNISPFKESNIKKNKGDGQSSRLLPATPVFSPAKSSSCVTPSSLPTTAELYKVLGLSTGYPNQDEKDVSHSSPTTVQSPQQANDTSVPASAASTPAPVPTCDSVTSRAEPNNPNSPLSDPAARLRAIKASLMQKSLFHKSSSDNL